MKTAEIRQRWLDFFEKRGHKIVPSASLISPDPTTLFTIAGMVPFIPYMTGAQTAPWKRATSVQKCVRTADIDEVGKTTRHGTFFQMNGNFSFGDYFREQAIEWAWEFVTGSLESGCLGMDKDKIWATVWEEDDEAYNKWLEVGLSEKHLQRRTKEENFWSTGGPGPAGPCSEIFFDRGPEYGEEGGPIHDDEVGSERYLEIWNLVFQLWQIDTVKSKYEFNIVGELKKKNIDTGMGLERVAFLLQNKDNLYEIDEVYPVIEKVQELTGLKYGDIHENDVHMRILADHIRSSLMIINDGIKPSNEGRGYVLRRLMRRSIRSMRLLGYEAPAMEALFTVSKEAMEASYPELHENFGKILEIVLAEEKTFSRTLKAGETFLEKTIDKVKSEHKIGGLITGADAFKLHDTHGFPIELTMEVAKEAGVKVDEKAFKELMTQQRQRAREDALKKRGAAVDVSVYSDLAKDIAKKLHAEDKIVVGDNAGLSQFDGYDVLTDDVRIVGIVTKEGPVQAVDSKDAKDSEALDVELILDKTPFYAQSGGQLADEGFIQTSSGAEIEIVDVQKPIPQLSVHKGRLLSGKLVLDDTGVARVDTLRRGEIAKAHTSTHIIHKALQEVAGAGATQAGSEDAPGRTRFDFHLDHGLSEQDLDQISKRINEKVRENSPVYTQYMGIDKAREEGAMALFGEKYGDRVRVVSLGTDDTDQAGLEDSDNSWSIELCGGTHVGSVGEIGSIQLVSEGSVGSGVRRIEALVGSSATGFHAKEHALVSSISQILGTKNPDEITDRIQSVMARLKESEKQLEKFQEQQLLSQVETVIKNAQDVNGILYVKLNSNQAVGEVSSDGLRSSVLDAKNRLGEEKPAVIAFAGSSKAKPIVIVATNQSARDKGIKAGDLVRVASKILGGGGGGKPDLAQGGGQDLSQIDNALIAISKEL
ncbi:MAG: alanine--tRNA ligase [Candidatus Ancillula sp.]|jgi:alanyl-tRNA synthetase|nr:alanine--tRNA ligase [Candidatus Ancillula sp.]